MDMLAGRLEIFPILMVLPALAPTTIRHSRIALENPGQRSKSVVAKPVVVTMDAT